MVAMPISIFCGFFLEWELLGLWSGVAVALLAIAVIEVVIIMRTDWEAVGQVISFPLRYTYSDGYQVVDDAKNRVEAS